MKKLLTVLITTLLVFVGCISQPESVESGDNYDDDHPFNSSTTVGDLEWIGRVIEPENDQEEYSKYELVKVDAEGNETVMYESALESLFPSISLKTSEGTDGSSLVLGHLQGYPEGGIMISVFFEEGEEVVRTMIQTFWGFIQQFTFAYPDSAEYQVEIETSNECSDYLDQKEFSEDMKTDVLGLNITSEGNTELFELSSPKRVSCEFIDGIVLAPVLKESDVQVNRLGVSIKLPGDIEAYTGRNDETKELEVYYY